MSDVNVEATREIAARAGNMFLPTYVTEADAPRGIVADADEQTALDAVFGAASSLWSPMATDEAVAEVFRQFCRLLPKLDLVPVYHDPATAEFHWAPVRAVLGGAGYRVHHELASMLVALYPQCPLDPGEDVEEWTKLLREAHRMSGWPVGLALAEWKPLTFALQPVDAMGMTPRWVKVIALFHILKHLRFSSVRGLVVTYRNTATSYLPDHRSSAIGAAPNVRQTLVDALGGPTSSSRKLAYPWTKALTSLLKSLNVGDLLRRRPLTDLPGAVLAGPWSRVVPDPTNIHGFSQHGLRLDGVWLAKGGKITEVAGESHDILAYDWALSQSATDLDRRKFEACLPATYDETSGPAAVLRHGFPNLNWTPFGGSAEAAACLIDAILCAGVMRGEVPALDLEKPLILCMPTVPEQEDATNTGKSKCAHTIARALCPGIKVSGVKDSDSAPDHRALAETVRLYGSVMIDEFRQPRAKSHLLSHENLQLLITGGEVVVGKAFENSSAAVSLAQPIVVSCKALDAPLDIVNRSLVLAMDRLTDEHRARADVLEAIENGALSLQMRLSAIALVENQDLVTKLLAARKNSTMRGWRFNALRALAILLWQQRHGEGGAEAVDEAVATMQQWFLDHTRKAETSGLLGVLEEGTTVKVRLHTLFTEMTSKDLELVLADCIARSETTGDRHGLSPTSLLKGVACAMGLGNAPLSRLLEYLAGQRGRVSDRSMAHALARDIRAVVPNTGDVWIMPESLGLAGWRIVRKTDVNGSPRLAIIQQAPAPLALTP